MNTLAVALRPHAPPAAGSVLMIQALGRDFAIPVGAVSAVARLGAITRTPGAPDFMLGLSNVRGRILAVLSLARRLDPTWRQSDGSPFVVIVEALGRTAALAVDKIFTVIDARAEEALPPPAQLDALIAQFTLGVLRHGGLLAPIIDTSALLDYPQDPTGGVRRTPDTPQNPWRP